MKKLIMQIMVIALSVSLAVGCPLSAWTADNAAPSYEAELSLLGDLSLLPDGFAAGFNAQKGMTRADFAELCVKLLGLDKYSRITGTAPAFSDVSSTADCYDVASLMHTFGLMTGDGNGNFNPDEKITYNAAVKVVMSALGYDGMASAIGGYPYGYIKLANDNNILDGVSDSQKGYITSGNIITMIVNSLNTPTLEIKSIENDSVIVSSKGGKTLLNVYHGINGYNGILQGVYGKQMLDIDPLTKTQIAIDGKIYKTSDSMKWDKYFGCEIEFYYDENVREVVAVTDMNSENNIITFSCADVESFSFSSLVYYDAAAAKEKQLSLSPAVSFVYNGRLCTELFGSDFTVGDGTLRLIDIGSDGKYDTVILSKIVNYVVKDVSTDDIAVYDMYGNGTFSAKELENVLFTDELGNEMFFAELFEYDVLSVAQSKDKALTIITYSNTEIEGTLDSVEASGGRIIIGGKAYGIAGNFASEVSKLSLGTKGLFVLDVNKNIAAFKSYDDSYRYGYLIAVSQSGGLDDTVKVKLMTAAGDIETYEADRKVTIDGTSVDISSVYSLLTSDGKTVQQPIRYYTVSGMLRAVDTAASHSSDSSSDSLRILYSCYDNNHKSTSTVRYNSSQMIFGSKIAAESNVPVFIVSPNYSVNDEDFTVKSLSIFSHDKSYALDAYVDSENEHFADVLVYYASTMRIANSNSYMLVDSVSRAIDADGEYCYKLSGLYAGKFAELYVMEDSIVNNIKSIAEGNRSNHHVLERGDVIDVSLHSTNGKVTAISLCYEVSSDTLAKNTGIASDLTSTDRMMKASVYSADSGNLWLTQSDLSYSGAVLDMREIEAINGSKFKIYKYSSDKSEPVVKMASISDIVDYKSSETAFSRVLMFCDYNNAGTLIIYD